MKAFSHNLELEDYIRDNMELDAVEAYYIDWTKNTIEFRETSYPERTYPESRL